MTGGNRRTEAMESFSLMKGHHLHTSDYLLTRAQQNFNLYTCSSIEASWPHEITCNRQVSQTQSSKSSALEKVGTAGMKLGTVITVTAVPIPGVEKRSRSHDRRLCQRHHNRDDPLFSESLMQDIW